MRMSDPGETARTRERSAEGAMPHSLRHKGLDQDEIWKAPGRRDRSRCADGATAGTPRESLR